MDLIGMRMCVVCCEVFHESVDKCPFCSCDKFTRIVSISTRSLTIDSKIIKNKQVATLYMKEDD